MDSAVLSGTCILQRVMDISKRVFRLFFLLLPLKLIFLYINIFCNIHNFIFSSIHYMHFPILFFVV
jgi:hypothetical protein